MMVCAVFFFFEGGLFFFASQDVRNFFFFASKDVRNFSFLRRRSDIFFLVFVEDVRTIRSRRKDRRRTQRQTDKGLRRKRERRVKSRCWP